MRDTSLRFLLEFMVILIDAQVYSREGADRDERLSNYRREKEKIRKDLSIEQNVIKKNNALGN